jgi:hypothetical protein
MGGTYEEGAKKHLPTLRLWVILERASSEGSYCGGHAEAHDTPILDEGAA